MYSDPYERELRIISSTMCGFLIGYSRVGYESALELCKRMLDKNLLTRDKIAEVCGVPVENVDALATGMTPKEIVASREGEEYLADKARQLLQENEKLVREAEEVGKEEYAKFREECRKRGYWG